MSWRRWVRGSREIVCTSDVPAPALEGLASIDPDGANGSGSGHGMPRPSQETVKLLDAAAAAAPL
jgi:hypothetical protein